MRHAKAFRKFGRSSSHRRALFKNLASSLIRHERLLTTAAKAKDLRRVSEKLITLAKEDTLHRRRQALAYLPEQEAVHKLFTELGPKFKTRPGGYTRILKTVKRVGDAAEMAIIELVQEPYTAGKSDKKKSKSKRAEVRAKGSSDSKEVVAEVAAAPNAE